MRTVVPTQQARQGVTGHNVRYVLGIGLAAAIVAFVVLYAIYFAYILARRIGIVAAAHSEWIGMVPPPGLS